MSKSQNKNGKTAAFPHRIVNKVAISMIRLNRVERKDFLGYEGVAPVNGGTITVRANCDIDAIDMKVFNFVLSQWQAMRKTENTDILYVDIPKILEALGIANRTENREMVIRHLRRMMGVNVTYDFSSGSLSFSTLDFIQVERFDVISIRISKTFEDVMIQAKERYINVDIGMKLKSGYAVELLNLLQIEGSGVQRNGLPTTVNSISHERICSYLCLEYGTKEAKEEIRRAFKKLEKIGIPKYTYTQFGEQSIWRQEGKNLSQKSLKSVQDSDTKLVAISTKLVADNTKVVAKKA